MGKRAEGIRRLSIGVYITITVLFFLAVPFFGGAPNGLGWVMLATVSNLAGLLGAGAVKLISWVIEGFQEKE